MADYKREADDEVVSAVAKKPKTDTPSTTESIPESYEKTHQVLSITELLENVLLFVDFNTLLLAQRVSSKWRDVITSNDKLQKKLFLKPAKSFKEVLSLGMVGGEHLVALCNPYSRDDYQIAVFNPMITETLVTKDAIPDELVGRIISDRVLPDTISARRGRSSWERMYLTQPPDFNYPTVRISIEDTVLKEDPPTDDDSWSEYHCCHSPSERTFREFLDWHEEEALLVREAIVKWKTVDLEYLGTWVTTYRDLEASGCLATRLDSGWLTEARLDRMRQRTKVLPEGKINDAELAACLAKALHANQKWEMLWEKHS